MVDNGVAGNDGSIMDMNMTAEQHAVNENYVVEDSAVVGHMAVGHEHIVIADACDVIFFFSTAVDGHTFAKNVVIADDDLSLRFLPADILGISPDHAARPEAIVLSDRGISDDDNIARQSGSITDFNIGTNDAKRPNRDSLADKGLGVNLRHWRDPSFHAIILIKIVQTNPFVSELRNQSSGGPATCDVPSGDHRQSRGHNVIQFVTTSSSNHLSDKRCATESQVANTIQNLMPNGLV